MLARTEIPDRNVRGRIGRRIRRRRLFLGLTQGALARALGVTFQQVQKYEYGVGRVPPERLAQIAHALEVTPDYFSSPDAEQADGIEHFVQSPDGIALCRAMALISDASVRARLLMAVAAFSDSEVRPEENEAQRLSAWLRRIGSDSESAQHSENVATSIHDMKVELARLIGRTLKARRLTQQFAARILHTDQARISNLSHGNVRAFSFEKLIHHLMLLGWNTAIKVSRRPINQAGKLELNRRDF
ncbi:MAG TPA: helix-turn-helix transcriptional regulator [Rhizomicrobium sp.]|jgi:transcriptional regulator with XRE-family HTH domain/predicted XRE-type DNA-binding protein|nr:helix-turn-helix transcriptional regulator [Rhizomicrobium sp.]